MPKFANFQFEGGVATTVNVDLVPEVRAADDGSDRCVIYFDKEHYLVVKGSALNAVRNMGG